MGPVNRKEDGQRLLAQLQVNKRSFENQEKSIDFHQENWTAAGRGARAD